MVKASHSIQTELVQRWHNFRREIPKGKKFATDFGLWINWITHCWRLAMLVFYVCKLVGILWDLANLPRISKTLKKTKILFFLAKRFVVRLLLLVCQHKSELCLYFFWWNFRLLKFKLDQILQHIDEIIAIGQGGEFLSASWKLRRADCEH
jgi:hypothetical protein